MFTGTDLVLQCQEENRKEDEGVAPRHFAFEIDIFRTREAISGAVHLVEVPSQVRVGGVHPWERLLKKFFTTLREMSGWLKGHP